MLSYSAFIVELIFNLLVSWGRMFAALVLSITISIASGIYIARHAAAEKLLIPAIDILQTLPILAFFPAVIVIFVSGLPGAIGINAAIIFLIITSMLWNILLAVYESIKLLPPEYLEVAKLSHMTNWQQIRNIFIPATYSGIVQQSMLSWAIGLFYLVTSEIFSNGSEFCRVSTCQAKYGIGVLLTNLAFSGHLLEYATGIALFIAFVIATMLLLFIPIEKRLNRDKQTSTANRLIDRLFAHIRPFKGLTVKMHLAQRTRERQEKHQRTAINAQNKAIPIRHKQNKRTASVAIAAVLAAVVIYGALLSLHLVNTFLNDEYITLLNLAASLARVWFAFLLVLIVGIPVSIYIVFMSKHADHYITLFQILASIPATILLPILAIALAGVNKNGNILAIVIFFIAGIWYVIFSIIAASRSISSEVLEVKRVFGIKKLNAWKNIYIKAIIPGLITGAITGIAAEWNSSIVGEYFTSAGITGSPNCAANLNAAAAQCTHIVSSVNYGIGKLLDTATATNNNALLAMALINMTAMIIIVNTLVWKQLYKHVASQR